MIEGLTLAIEKFKKEMKIDTYVEAVCLFVEENQLDYYDVVDQIDDILKKKLKAEYIRGNFIPDKKVEGTLDDFMSD